MVKRAVVLEVVGPRRVQLDVAAVVLAAAAAYDRLGGPAVLGALGVAAPGHLQPAALLGPQGKDAQAASAARGGPALGVVARRVPDCAQAQAGDPRADQVPDGRQARAQDGAVKLHH